MKSNLKLNCSVTVLSLLLSVFILAGCDSGDVDDIEVNTVGDTGIVVTTDYSTGAVSVVTAETRVVQRNTQVIHSDSICRYDEVTGHIFVISRFGSDAITVLNEDAGYKPMAQYSVEAGTNAQDIAVIGPGRAVVPRIGSPELLVVHPTLGTEIARVDLSAYADSDGNPEASQAIFRDGKVYVTLQRLDMYWAPTDYSALLIINPATYAIEREVILNGKNPTGILRYNTPLSAFILTETGSYGVLDGGIETMTLDGTLSGMIITEATLGGDIIDAIVTAPDMGFAIISEPTATGAATRLVTFNPMTGFKGETLISSAGYDLSYMSLNGESEIWVTDRNFFNPGIRIFDTHTAQELTASPIDVGLPPIMVCFER
ncbi:MAG: hypothetical protein JXX14_02960 [Deltaproteobacteria bacterium]|nr:hypothetical protein [Deltaproteobacteria bacterium]